MENKTTISVCKNCQKDFVIEPDDFGFYERIGVPAPQLCPECRMQRRLAFNNLLSLHKRPCDLCGEDSISLFAPNARYKVYCQKCWWSDDWDPFEYGKDFDFSRPFFEQFDELLHEVPLLGLSLDYPSNINSPYNNECGPLKNCYLLFYGVECEETATGFYLVQAKNLLDTSLAMWSQWCYDCRNIAKNNRCIGVENTTESIDCAFLRNCRNCQNCFGSANLKNKKFVFFNEQLTKNEYETRIANYDLGSYAGYKKAKADAKTHWAKYPPKPIWMDFSVNCTGNYIFDSKNCQECYEVVGAEDGKYLSMITSGPVKNAYDITGWGENMTLCYECSGVGENVSDMLFCFESGINAHHCQYSKLSTGGAYHFGCVSIKKGEYCIFNKRYSREEYERLVAKIKIQMTNDKEYGEFFPMAISPHPYNETLANEFFPRGIEAEGEKRTYNITMRASELPDHISDVTPLILKNVIECGECGKGYRIIQMELDFLKQMNLPLPRRCPFCRIKEKFRAWVKQMRLVSRACRKCAAEFKTPYTNEEYPNILCIECWKQEYA